MAVVVETLMSKKNSWKKNGYLCGMSSMRNPKKQQKCSDSDGRYLIVEG